ncbi:MAG: VWA domain-containing protein [Lentisphaeria bacterium]|nr:VWA domain-containing protein [Lentisphaeria bacterium]
MQFLNPGMLWALPCVLIPILIIIFLKRKKVVIHWAAFPWMKQAVLKKKKKVLKENWLKLFSKMLLILAVILALLNPMFKGNGGSSNVIFIIDNSPSMGTIVGSDKRLAKAGQFVLDFTQDHNGEVMIYSYSNELVQHLENFTLSDTQVKGAIEEIDILPHAGGIQGLLQLLNPTRMPLLNKADQIIIISDFQQDWYAIDDGIKKQLTALTSKHGVSFVQVDPRVDVPNISLNSFSIYEDGIFSGQKSWLYTEMENHSDMANQNRYRIFLGDEVIEDLLVNLNPREVKVIKTPIQIESTEWINLFGSITSDALTFDNRRESTYYLKGGFDILILQDSILTSDTKVEPPSLYIQAVLKSIMNREQVNVKVADTYDIESENLSNYDFVFMIGAGVETDTQKSILLDYLNGGGHVISMLDASSERAPIEGLYAPFKAESQPQNIDRQRVQGTWLSFMDGDDMKPENISFKNSFVFEPSKQFQAMLFADRGCIGYTEVVDKGMHAVCGFVPYRKSSNFAFNPNFVQFLNRLVWSIYKPASHTEVNLVNDFVHVSNYNPQNNYTLVDESGDPLQLLSEGLGEDVVLKLPNYLRAGIYSVQENQDELARFAVDRESGDSNLLVISDSDIEGYKSIGIQTFEVGEDTVSNIRQSLTWLLFILLGLAILLELYAHFLRKEA